MDGETERQACDCNWEMLGFHSVAVPSSVAQLVQEGQGGTCSGQEAQYT